MLLTGCEEYEALGSCSGAGLLTCAGPRGRAADEGRPPHIGLQELSENGLRLWRHPRWR